MHRSRLLSAAALLALTLPAQIAPHAPDGGTRERFQSIAILPKPGAPFRAVVVTEWTRNLADGTTVTLRNHRTVARDSTGRIFEERRYFTPHGDTEVTSLTALQFSDPARHEFTDCLPATHTCTVSAYNPLTAVSPELVTSIKLPGWEVTRENLGDRTIENLPTVGSREITTRSGPDTGYKTPEPTVKEFWFAPRLEINLLTKRFDPRGNAQTFTVTHLDLNEPDPRLFIPPADFRTARTVLQ